VLVHDLQSRGLVGGAEREHNIGDVALTRELPALGKLGGTPKVAHGGRHDTHLSRTNANVDEVVLLPLDYVPFVLPAGHLARLTVAAGPRRAMDGISRKHLDSRVHADHLHS